MKLSYVVGGAVAAAVLVAIIVVLVPKTPCNGGVCKVTVTIQDCAGGGITATPDPIPVPSANNIEWTIPNSDDYVFTANGISVHGSGFTNMPGVTGNGKKFIIHDAYSDPTHRIKYAIEVRPSNGTSACKIADPFINHE